MKKVQVFVNAILSVAIVVLFILYFTSGKSAGSGEGETFSTDTLSLNNTTDVVYVNIDTLLANYDMYHDFEGKFEEKQKSSEAQLDDRSKKWQTRVSNYQDLLKKGLITRSKAAEMEQQLGQEQQDILQLKDQLSAQLMEQQQVMNRQILFSIMEYLEKYNQGKYRYILSNSVGGNLLYADPVLDITDEVIRGINEYYAGIRDSVLQANQ